MTREPKPPDCLHSECGDDGYWNCRHPDAEVTETNIQGFVVKHYAPCELECGEGCAFPDVWKRAG